MFQFAKMFEYKILICYNKKRSINIDIWIGFVSIKTKRRKHVWEQILCLPISREYKTITCVGQALCLPFKGCYKNTTMKGENKYGKQR